MIIHLFLNVDNHYYLTLSTSGNRSLINWRRYRTILPAGSFTSGCAHHIPDILRIRYLVGFRDTVDLSIRKIGLRNIILVILYMSNTGEDLSRITNKGGSMCHRKIPRFLSDTKVQSGYQYTAVLWMTHIMPEINREWTIDV